MSLDRFRKREVKPDYILMLLIFSLLIFGLIMIYSASGYIASRLFNNASFYLNKQTISLSVGLVIWYIFAKIDYRFWKKSALWLLIATLITLTAVFIPGIGIAHPRLGLASHFSLSANVPSIGVSNAIFDCEIKGEEIIRDGKKVGRKLITKPGSKPLYISPGNQISIDTSYALCKQFINLPHKFPEPMHLARKYGRGVEKELKAGG